MLCDRFRSSLCQFAPALLELEQGYVVGAIDQAHEQLAAATSPALVSLPGVTILPARRVVAQAAAAGRHRLLDVISRRAAVAGDLSRDRIATVEDAQPPVATQAELD